MDKENQKSKEIHTEIMRLQIAYTKERTNSFLREYVYRKGESF